MTRRLAVVWPAILAVLIPLTPSSPAIAATPTASVDANAVLQLQNTAMASGAVGVYVDSSGTAVVVMPSDLASAFTTNDASTFGVPARVATIQASSASIAGVTSGIWALGRTPSRSYSFAGYFDYVAGHYVIFTTGSYSDFQPLSDQFPGLLFVQAGADLRLAGGRMADSPPYWGGAVINGLLSGSTYQDCTSGYLVAQGGLQYMVTAGHCFEVGAVVKASKYSNSGSTEGTVTQRYYPNFEGELYSCYSCAPTFYSGANGDDYSDRIIYGQKLEVNGQTGYCRTGWVSGNSCGAKLTDNNGFFCNKDNGLCTQNLDTYTGSANVAGGDSGGPIYWPYNGGGLIQASIVGFSGSTFWGQGMQRLINHFGGSEVCQAGQCVIQ